MILPGRLLLTILLALSAATSTIYAQLCQGSLGDPLVNITFGAGANPGAPLVAAATSYQYSANDCPSDGFYTVRNNTSVCFGTSWHTLNNDHTGNAGGYFMLVNASYDPGAFYLDTVKGLCGGTTYEFAAWVMNVLRIGSCTGNLVQPNLTFSIERTDGTPIQTYSTGIIPSQPVPTWQQWGFFFITPTGVSDIVLRIVNNSPGGCGNDLALDDITFRPCGPQLSVGINGFSTNTVKFCEGDPHAYNFTGGISPGFNNPSFQWQQSINGGTWTDIPGETNLAISQNFPINTAPGTYAYRLSAAEVGNMASVKCRVVSDPLTIVINANPVTNASGNSPVCEGKQLSMTAGGGATYQWTGINGFTASGDKVTIDNALAGHSGRYYVLVTSDAGCTHLDSVDATVNINPVAALSFAETMICEGAQVQLQGSGNGQYKWEPATGLSSFTIADPVASPRDTTHYSMIVTNQFACTDTAFVTVNVAERPRANAGPDKYIMRGKTVALNALAGGQNISYTWSPSVFIDNARSLQPLVSPPHDTTYVLAVTSNEGCGTATDAMRVHVYQDVFIPNAFSPNNDGINDTWFIPSLRAWSEYTVSVFNRYGQVIFQTKNSTRPWDGKYKGVLQPNGVYIYVVDLKDDRLLKGTVMIVR